MTGSSIEKLAETLRGGDRGAGAAQLGSALAAVADPFERTLVLHLGALAAAAAGDLAGLERFLSEAAALEAGAGFRVGSQHTLHQLALFSSNQGNIRAVASYYRATAATLQQQKNAVGLAFCHRSLGEILLFLGKVPEALRYWGFAEQSLRLREQPEAEQLRVWIAALAADGSLPG